MWMHRVSTLPYFHPLSLIFTPFHTFIFPRMLNHPSLILSLHSFVRPSCHLLTQLSNFDRSHSLIHAHTLHHPFTHSAVSPSTCVLLVRPPTRPSTHPTHPVHPLSARPKYVTESPNFFGILTVRTSKNTLAGTCTVINHPLGHSNVLVIQPVVQS
jgi:hypothetical protein